MIGVGQVHMFTGRREFEGAEDLRSFGVADVNDLETAVLVKEVEAVAIERPDIRFDHGPAAIAVGCRRCAAAIGQASSTRDGSCRARGRGCCKGAYPVIKGTGESLA